MSIPLMIFQSNENDLRIVLNSDNIPVVEVRSRDAVGDVCWIPIWDGRSALNGFAGAETRLIQTLLIALVEQMLRDGRSR